MTDKKKPALKAGEAAPNYNYGVGWEKYVANYFKARFGGTYDISPGSRGAADCINYTPDLIICTQVKASRDKSKSHPNASILEQEKLRKRAHGLAAARKKPAVAMLALIKGTSIRFKKLQLYRPVTQ